jgi:hypothetical protein
LAYCLSLEIDESYVHQTIRRSSDYNSRFQNVDTPKYQCGIIQIPEGTLHDTADTRRPRFSFFLTNNVKNQTKTTPSPRPNIPVKPWLSIPTQMRKNLILRVRYRVVQPQTLERAPQPPEATAPPRSMSGVIGPHFWTVNEDFPEKSFSCHVIENTAIKLVGGVGTGFRGSILCEIQWFFHSVPVGTLGAGLTNVRSTQTALYAHAHIRGFDFCSGDG